MNLVVGLRPRYFYLTYRVKIIYVMNHQKSLWIFYCANYLFCKKKYLKNFIERRQRCLGIKRLSCSFFSFHEKTDDCKILLCKFISFSVSSCIAYLITQMHDSRSSAFKFHTSLISLLIALIKEIPTGLNKEYRYI